MKTALCIGRRFLYWGMLIFLCDDLNLCQGGAESLVNWSAYFEEQKTNPLFKGMIFYPCFL
ncbi:MAG: hypothetical protein P4M13_01205 [Alphaproteobacteria bacterium]|nr:hypothetical protein [Alphaproteobacteria bacterium]